MKAAVLCIFTMVGWERLEIPNVGLLLGISVDTHIENLMCRKQREKISKEEYTMKNVSSASYILQRKLARVLSSNQSCHFRIRQLRSLSFRYFFEQVISSMNILLHELKGFAEKRF